MSKVLGIIHNDKEFDNGEYIGYTECCGAVVRKSRCGCDEECPKCGELLDWWGEE